MAVRVEEFGHTKSGDAVHKITLTNSNGIEVELITYGAIIRALRTPDRDGKISDIVLGFDTLEGYLGKNPYFGATVGRVANRTANGRFSLDGQLYHLVTNNGPNHLHGGLKGFDKVVWRFHVGENQVTFHHLSKDGDEGYPGDLDLQVTFLLSEDALNIKYVAKTTRPTIVNLTNHSYFNLGGQVEENVLNHIAEINAHSYLPTNKTQIPTGEIVPVEQDGGIFDFNQPKAIGKDIEAAGGYDHNFCLKKTENNFCARVCDPSKSGRVLEVFTSQPGVQLYTANKFDDGLVGKGGIQYKEHQGFCLETQNYPDSVNQPNFPNSILRPGEVYDHFTTLKFSVE